MWHVWRYYKEYGGEAAGYYAVMQAKIDVALTTTLTSIFGPGEREFHVLFRFWEPKFHVIFALRSESSRVRNESSRKRKFHGTYGRSTFALGSESMWERKFQLRPWDTYEPSRRAITGKKNYGTFVPTYFRSQERKYHRWNFISLPGTFAPWNFRSLELSLPGTFAPKCEK